MKSKSLALDFKGLVTAPGRVAAAPGSLVVAQNVDFPAPGLCSKRKGIEATAQGFGGACWSLVTSRYAGDVLLANTGNGTDALSLQFTDGITAPANLTTPDGEDVTNTPDARMKGAILARNQFLTSTRAPIRVESDFNLGALYAGMPRSPGCFIEASQQLAPGAGGFLAYNYACAYRVVWMCRDVEGVQRLSAPSARWLVINAPPTTGASALTPADVDLRLALPYEADTAQTAIDYVDGWDYLVFRTKQVDWAGGLMPNDEMQLVYQGTLTAAQVAAGFVLVTDTCPDSMQGEYLYTNTVSGGDINSGLVRTESGALGIAGANDRPPLATDVAVFANCAFWANIKTLYRLKLTVLAVGSTAGTLQVGDTFTIYDGVNSRTYTGVAAPSAVVGEFHVQLGFASVTLNTTHTLQNLCAAINRDTGNDFINAYYLGNDGQPGTVGQFFLEARKSNAAVFQVSGSNPTVFIPDITNSPLATRDEQKNGLAISKPGIADAVPPVNYVQLGDNDAAILRVIPHRDILFVFKEDGLWWVRGGLPSEFVFEPFDPTFRLLGREACVTCDDAVYAWGIDGIARITTGGVEYLDTAIKNLTYDAVRGLDDLATSQLVGYENFSKHAFACAYPTQKRVLFFFRNGKEQQDYGASTALVFHVETGVWSRYEYDLTNAKLCGVVRVNDEKLHLGEWSTGTDTQLYRDRRNYNDNDYRDTNVGGDIVSISSVLQWNVVTSEPDALTRWIETSWQFGRIYEYGVGLTAEAPSSFEAQAATDISSGFQNVTITNNGNPLSQAMRMTMPWNMGFGMRLSLRFVHDLVQAMSMNGWVVRYDVASQFGVR